MKKSVFLFFLFLLFHMIQIQGQNNKISGLDKPLVSFGLIADVQYCDCPPGGERYYKKSLEKLTDCVNNFNNNDLDFVVNLGDLIDRDFSSYDDVLNIFGRLKSPIHHVLGNHDFSVKRKKKSLVNKKLGLNKRYYSLSLNNIRFIFLDGNDISLYSKSKLNYKTWKAALMLGKLKRKGALNATDWNAGIGTKQKNWLDEMLQSAVKEGENVIIFCHFPVLPEGSYYNLWNNEQIKRIIANYDNIVAYISGHDHKGEYNFVNGTYFLTMKGMVETPDSNAFAIVEVYTDHLKVRGFGREEDRELKMEN